ncbi:LOW QUALITY PROTEIN: 14-3-3 protein eta-like [Branchiostoma floridae]|uniref:LOW QUALITY PROTEIN: 14-3-3 protein eta-like n=1 Tax=Branchiostoma floridae TaxID=7739 RepID=A0A9J7LJM2_BRAFL|nr:LOW QUALITY PROTEIN: 14-3-3 protein eta-like [Branchiostoma floridae]
MADKEALIQKAKLWEQAERWQDMASCMKQVVEMIHMSREPLTAEERNLLSVAYKNKVGSRRSALRIIASAEQKAADGSETRQAAKWLREKVETEMKEMCGEVVKLLDRFLIPMCITNLQPEAEVFYCEMKGDYLRYLAEISEGEEREHMVKDAKAYYEKAHDVAAIEMPATHPIRLGLALNFSVFHYEIRNDHQEACRLAQQAYADAMLERDNLPEDSNKDSTLIMELLRENATRWMIEN